jgi:tetratricopeptide (TPR) repeat protein
VMKILGQRDEWLLIFDNADDFGIRNAILRIMPRLNRGRVLVTSRLSVWGDGVKQIEVKKLEREPAREYLIEKTEGKRINHEEDCELAEELAVLLDGLPVALQQAAGYIGRMRIGFARYLKEYRENQKKMLAWEKEHKLPQDYPWPVMTTWEMTEKRLSTEELAILHLAAFLSSESIPLELFEKQPKAVGTAAAILGKDASGRKAGETNKYIHVRETLAALADWSMIEFGGASFSVHRLVQETTRLLMDRETQGGLCGIVLAMLKNSDPGYASDDVRSWVYWKEIEKHIAAAVEYGDVAGIVQPTTILMGNLGLYYLAQARYSQAEPMMNRALLIDTKTFGKDHPNVARDMINLAGLFEETNRFPNAEVLIQQVLHIFRNIYGNSHPETAIAMNNLAQLYQKTNRLDKAEPLMKRVLEINETSFDKDHPDVARSLNNLARLYHMTGRLSEAEPMFNRAIGINEAIFGKDHPEVAVGLNNLALLYQATNRLTAAERLMKQALVIDETSYGKDHPMVARELNNIAMLLRAMKRIDEAEPLMKRALVIDEIAFGKDSPNVARDLNNQAGLYRDMGRLFEAETMLKQAIVIILQFTRQTGHPHPNLKDTINSYAGLLLEMGLRTVDIAKRLTDMGLDMVEA